MGETTPYKSTVMLVARKEDIRGEWERGSKIQDHLTEPERERERESSNTFSSEILKLLH